MSSVLTRDGHCQAKGHFVVTSFKDSLIYHLPNQGCTTQISLRAKIIFKTQGPKLSWFLPICLLNKHAECTTYWSSLFKLYEPNQKVPRPTLGPCCASLSQTISFFPKRFHYLAQDVVYLFLENIFEKGFKKQKVPDKFKRVYKKVAK